MIIILSSIFLSFFVAPAVSMQCIDTKHPNLKLEKLFWSEQPFIYQSNRTFSFTFNLCHQSGNCPSDSLICAKTENKTFNIGVTLVNTTTQFDETVLEFSSNDATSLAETGCKNFTTFIYFTCDKNSLGVPLLLNNPDCVYYFEWKTLAICQGSIADEVHQVPCYLNHEGDFYNLGSLVDRNSAHDVKTLNENDNLMINLCRNISFPPTPPCSGKAASCNILNGTSTEWGFVDRSTKIVKEVNHLSYKLTASNDGKSTEIKLYCSEPGDGQDPIEVEKNGTVRMIQWSTVYACPIKKDEESAGSCKFGNLDLTALNNTYNVAANGEFSYELALCGSQLTDCGDAGDLGPVVACQKKTTDTTYKVIIGRGRTHSHFRYSDAGLTLLATKGAACSSGYQREIVINFICDNNIPLGQPQFKSEEDCTYNFDWHTALVCKTKPSCKYTSTKGVSYDFSSLTVNSDATIWTTNTGTGIAYVNICGPVGRTGNCNPASAVCHSNATGVNQNWGLSSTAQFSENSDNIILTYSQGDSCSTGNISTEIHLKCETSGAHGFGPAYQPDPSTSCLKIFEFYTEAACSHSNSTISANCTLKSSSDYVYEFSSLGQLTYKDGGNSYAISMCSKSLCGTKQAYICKNQSAVDTAPPRLVENGQDQVTVTFTPDPESGGIVQLHLHCNHTANNGKITSMSTQGAIQAFDVDTALVCSPKSFRCDQLSDGKGHKFDISKLADQKLTAVDRARNMTYYFSVCGHLTQPSDCANESKAINVCQKTSSNESVNLGYIASPLIITNEDGTYQIRVHAINGKPCGHGDKTPRQTTITMICSQDEYTPTVNEDGNCNYDITWRTKNACPTEENVVSPNCTITVNNDMYDFCSLKGRTLQFNNGSFEIDLFGKFATGPCKDSSVCKNVSGDSEPIGTIVDNNELEVIDNHIILAMPGKQCGIEKVNSILTFYCPTEAQPNGTTQYVAIGRCSHYFTYYTTLACEPVESTICSRNTADGFHDLTSLMLHDSNYRAVGQGDYSSDRYIINICHRINPTVDARGCPSDAAACLINKDGKVFSLGRLKANTSPVFKISGDVVFIQYFNGSVCPSDPTKNMRTLIIIRCDHSQTTPSLMTREEDTNGDNCNVNFMWTTAAACAITNDTQTCEQIGLDQSTINTQYMVESTNHQYYVNFPCGSKQSNPIKQKCGNKDFGVCQVSKRNNAEEVVAGLMTHSARKLEDESYQFNYTNGTTCAHDPKHRPRNVVLTIYCSHDPDEQPKLEFAGETAEDCTYSMSWGRKDACVNLDHVSCQVSTPGGGVIDLNSLSGRSNLQVTSGANGDIYMDVCQPLPVIKENLFCPPGSSVCLKTTDGILDLGQFDSSPVYDSNSNSVTLTYNSKTKCRDEQNYKSIITFTCSPDSIGSPQLVTSGDDCVYRFTWQTMVVCQTDHGGTKPPSSNECQVTDSQSGYKIDLTPLKLHDDFQVSDYKLSICRSIKTSNCAGNTTVCKNSSPPKSYGLIGSAQFISTPQGVDLQYEKEGGCDEIPGSTEDNKHYAMIKFICDRTAGIGHPEIVDIGLSCQVQFEWKTSVVCVPDCTYTFLNQTYNFQHLNNHRTNYKITGNSGETYDLNICRGLTQTSCGDSGLDVSVCLSKPHFTKQPLAVSNTMTIQHWGKDSFGLVQYGYDNTLCDNTQNHPTVLIHVYCSNKLADPTFVKYAKGNCTHIFQWPTPVACHDQVMKEIEVKLLSNGSFIDPTETKIYDLAPIVNRLLKANDGTFDYYFKLNGPITNDTLDISPNCTKGDTSVCQHDVNLKRPIGTTPPTYYYKDDELVVFYKSNSQCGRFHDLTTTVRIHLICNQTANGSNPGFSYESRACLYVLSLSSNYLCNPRIIPKSSTGNALSSGAIAAIIIVTLLVAAVLFTVVYKLRRRRRSAYDQPIGYSRVNQDDDSTLLINSSRPLYADDDDDLII